VLLHASAGCTRDEYEDAAETILDISGKEPPPLKTLPRGAICGAMTLSGQFQTDVLHLPRMHGWWASNQYGWHIENVVEIAPVIECRGSLGFWTVPADVEKKIEELAKRKKP
jgi:hypothetical protein